MPPSVTKPVPDSAFPYWPPGGYNPGGVALGRAIAQTVADLPVNQSPSGSNLEIPVIQRIQPRQARASGPGSTENEERGTTDGDLYRQFMSSLPTPKGG